MGASQRRKGARGELEACRVLEEHLGGTWTRGGSAQRRQGDNKPADVESDQWAWLHVEVKRQARPSPLAALEQAVEDAGLRTPVALVRRDRDPLGWVVCMRLEDLDALVKRARGDE